MRLTANEVGSKSPRGFESLRLRNCQNRHESAGFVACCERRRDSKDGAGTQDERSEGLSASPGRKFLVKLELVNNFT